MILTVDIGNTRIKWAFWASGEIVARGVSVYEVENIAVVFDELFLAVQQPKHIYAACVAGDSVASALNQWCVQKWQCEVAFLKTEKNFNNIVNAYENPAQHGVDRWAALVAGYQFCSGTSVCVINAGTAITFDFINKNGQHLGGYILPSYATMRAALISDTTNVESAFNMQFSEQGIPNNTADAVSQGLHKLLQAGIREFCQQANNELETPVCFLLTGGFAEIILQYPDMPVMEHRPDLVMEGVYKIMFQDGRNQDGAQDGTQGNGGLQNFQRYLK